MKTLIGLSAIALLTLSGASSAATVIVTSPGVLNNPTTVFANDPLVADTWLRRNVRNDGSVGINANYPNATTGSAWLSGTQGPGGNSSKADFEYYFSNPVPLAAVSTLSYEWYRSDTSAAANHLHPSMRMIYDADGNLLTTSDQGHLIFENAYNPSVAPVPTNQWVFNDIANFNGPGQSANMWMTNFGNPSGSVLEIYNRDLGDWLSSANPNASYPSLNNGAMIVGLSFGFGSGWGSFDGAVDMVSFGVTGGPSTTWNFEVPTPGAAGLFAVAGLAGLRRRRAA